MLNWNLKHKGGSKMLDYEVVRYNVEYGELGLMKVAIFTEEEKAIKFIKENRYKWNRYCLLKIQSAVIDF